MNTVIDAGSLGDIVDDIALQSYDVTEVSEVEDVFFFFDTTAEAPDVTVADTSGAEDTAIPLNIAADVADLDGSEDIQSIVISNVPAGAKLSTGTDNGNGNWTLTQGDLIGLTIALPAHSGDDFQLIVTVTAVETESGDTDSTTSTLNVSVSGVADAPVIDVSPAAGLEDSSIPLDISVALVDLDGSETITDVTVTGVPSGAWLSAGTDLGGGTWLLTPAQLSGLTITPPANSSEDFQLTVSATSTEFDGDEATVVAMLDVDVVGVADQPTVAANAATGNEDSAILLNITAAFGDTLDGSETHTITISGVPTGAQLSAGTDNGGGTWALTPAQLSGLTITPLADSNVDFTLSVTATALEDDGNVASDVATFNVDVVGVADQPTVTAQNVGGNEVSAILLNITAAFGDALDGSETHTVTISGVPAGAQLSAGTYG